MSHPFHDPQNPLSPELLETVARVPKEMERSLNPERAEKNRLKMIIYLIPFVGFVPAIWSLYRTPRPRSSGDNNAQQKRVQEAARLAVTTGGAWALVTMLLATGGLTGQSIQIQALLATSLLTSGYFLTNVWLMIQVLRRQRLYVAGLSEVSQRWVDRRPQRRKRPH